MASSRWSWLIVASLVPSCSEPPREDEVGGATSDASDSSQPMGSTSSPSEDETGPEEKLDIGTPPDMGTDTPPSEASCDDLEDLPTNQAFKRNEV